MPGEYAAIGRPLGPDPWKVTDIIATASLVGGIFGKGGGDELTQMELRRSFRARYGARRGERLWREWAAYEDADAPTTVRSRRFPYQTQPKRPARGGMAIADAGSLRRTQVVAGGSGPGAAATRVKRAPTDGLLPAGLRTMGMSNALVVSAAESASGKPVAVFGPQTSYFAPQILMEQDVHAPGLDARGAAFPGVNLYVQLGRGQDYAWSATSAGQDIIDTFAVDLCEPDGSAPTTASMHYRYRGDCIAIEVLDRTNRWSPTLADATAAGTQRLHAERTKLGLVSGRATIKGRPIAYTRLRSTYLHEVDSALGFADFNDPGKVHDAASFQRAAYRIGYTFNWLYADDRDIAYFNSGNNPQRAAGVTGQLPMPARLPWRGFDAERNTAAYTSFAKHPQAINGQPYLTSWNNKQARGYAGADSNLFSSVYRSQMLDEEIDKRIAGPAKIDLPGLVEAMGEAATTDLRAEQVLPLALRVIGTPADPEARRGRGEAARLGRRRRAPPRPRRRRRLRARRGDPHPRRVLAAVDARAVPALARQAALRPADRRARARQHAQQPRRPPGLGLPGRLVRLRRQGPAPGARAEGARAVLQALLRRRPARALPRRAARRAGARRSPPTPRRSTATPPAPPPASPTTRPASTRSSSARRARSRSR